MSLQNLLNGDIETLEPQIKAVNLMTASALLSNFQYREYFLKEAGAEHYKLLAYVASLFPGQTIYDIGTHFGGSSVALAETATKVVSYDIMQMRQMTALPSNVDYPIGDFRKDPDVLTSPFIFIDVDPHDGVQEKDFHEFFVEKNYKGIVLWDDIYANLAMTDWWNAIKDSDTIRKVDLTKVGHWSGTGMIVYG